MKAKYDIYIRKDLQASLDKEPNMSGLINDLLADHFKKVSKSVNDLATAGIRSNVELVRTDEGISHVITPNKQDVKKFKKKIADVLEDVPQYRAKDNPFCKHERPMATCTNPDCMKQARNKGLV